MKLRRRPRGPDAAPGSAPADGECVKPFLDHLEDLRWTLFRSLLALAAGLGIAFPLAPAILRALQWPLARAGLDPSVSLRTLEVAGALNLSMQVAFWSGLLLSAPFIVYVLADFVFPGLTPRERRLARRAGGAAGALFLGGVALGYYGALPLTLRVLYGMNAWMGVRAEWLVSSYLTFCLRLLLAFGLVFELPVFLYVLGRLGLVSADRLRRWRPHAIVILLVVAALLTPPDVVSQIVMAAPLILMYELCILALRRHKD